MREILAKAGERTRVLHLFSDSIPQNVRFTAEAVSGDAAPSGTVEVAGSAWLFAKPPQSFPLQARQEFRKGFWDTNYAVHVTADQDTKITFQSRHFTSRALMFVLIAVVVLAAASVFLVPLF